LGFIQSQLLLWFGWINGLILLGKFTGSPGFLPQTWTLSATRLTLASETENVNMIEHTQGKDFTGQN
jgi:hypothetical protein